MLRALLRPCAPLALIAGLLGASAPAAPPGSSPLGAGGLEMNGYQIETEQTNWNLNNGDFTMPKEVRVMRPGSDARGDRAKGNTKLGTATLIGNVVIHDNGGAPEAREAGAGGQEYNGPSTITCDQLTIDTKTKTYDAQGTVHFTQGDRSATADRGVLNQLAHTLHLEGNVRLTQAGSAMKAAVVDYNLATKDVVASGAPMVITQPIPAGPPAPAPSPKGTKKP